ncbi:MAG: glycosyltransferase family 28 protein [Rhizobium sp.]|nr:glycosyltransferase family 28 protein [Rhizobium sp.]
MILVTVGTQLPFERLIQAIDEFATKLPEPVFAQIGRSSYRPKNIEFCETMVPRLFETKFQQASRIVSHAGTGSVLTAKRYGKPIILFPRRADAGEHRNDHQLATCEQLEGRPGIFVAYDIPRLEHLLSNDLPPVPQKAADEPEDPYQELVNGLANFIDSK